MREILQNLNLIINIIKKKIFKTSKLLYMKILYVLKFYMTIYFYLFKSLKK